MVVENKTFIDFGLDKVDQNMSKFPRLLTSSYPSAI